VIVRCSNCEGGIFPSKIDTSHLLEGRYTMECVDCGAVTTKNIGEPAFKRGAFYEKTTLWKGDIRWNARTVPLVDPRSWGRNSMPRR